MISFDRRRKLLFGAAIALLLALVCPSICIAAQRPHVSIAYFYVNACGSCDPEGEFKLIYDSIIGSLDDSVDVDLQMHNTFHGPDAILLREYCEKYHVPDDRQQVPILFINQTYLSGMDEIKAGLRAEFVRAVQAGGQNDGLTGADQTNAAGIDGKYSATKNSTDNSVVIYFYVPSCDDCQKAAQTLKTLKSQYMLLKGGREITSHVTVEKYNTGEPANMQLIKDYFAYYVVPEKNQKVPIVFVGNKWFSGADAIKNGLERALTGGEGLATTTITDSGKQNPHTDSLSGYTLLGVLAAGLVNGLNPCSLSIVLFLLSLLAVKQVNLLKAGIAFIAGKFVMFLLLGTVLYQLFLHANINWLQTTTKIILAVLALALMALNTQDMVSAKREQYGKIRLQVPRGLRRLNHTLVKSLSRVESERVFLPLSCLVGMLVAAGEFLCTGQIYLATLVLVVQNSPAFDARSVLYLVVYGLAFILPLLLVTGLIYSGKEIFGVSETIRSKMPLIKLINSVVFFVFAVVIIVFI